MKVLDVLIENNRWKIVCREEVSLDSNILNGRLFLAIKDEVANKELCKARFVVQRYKDAMKQSLLHSPSVSRQLNINIIVGLADSFSFQLYSSNFTVLTMFRTSCEESISKSAQGNES